jgi:hypothetical protein
MFSCFKFLNKKIEDEAVRRNIWPVGEISLEAASDIYRQCSSVVEVSQETPRGRLRRNNQLKWRGVVKVLRQEQNQ